MFYLYILDLKTKKYSYKKFDTEYKKDRYKRYLLYKNTYVVIEEGML